MIPTADNCLQVTDQQLESAFAWLCKQRSHYPDNADIWWFRAHWDEQKAALLATLNSGAYVLLPQLKCCKKDGQVLHLWSSQDALVLKVLTDVLQQHLDLSQHCTHLKGNGGLKHTVAEVQEQLKDYKFVCKTDVKGYYASIDQYLLLNMIADQIPNKVLRSVSPPK